MSEIRVVGDWIELDGERVARLEGRIGAVDQFVRRIVAEDGELERLTGENDKLLNDKVAKAFEIHSLSERLATALKQTDEAEKSRGRLLDECRYLQKRLKRQMLED